MKKLMFTLMAAVTLTGCGSGRVNEKAYLRAAALNGSEVTLVFYSEDDAPVTVTADDPEDAIAKAEIAVGKTIFTGHTELVLLNDCDTAGLLEHILHRWKVSPGCMVVRDEPRGSELLAEHTPEQLTGAIKTAQKQGKAPKCDIVTVLAEELR